MERFEPQYLDPNDYKEIEEVANEVRELLNNKKYFKGYFKMIKFILHEAAVQTGWVDVKEELKDAIKEKFSFLKKKR